MRGGLVGVWTVARMVVAIALLLVLGVPMARAETFELVSFTLDAGGGASADDFFNLSGTVGQPDAGIASDGFYRLEGGFWGASATAGAFITRQPSSTNVDVGDSIVFEVAGSGNPPFEYQWRLNGVILEGETNATLSRANIQVAQAGTYDVIIRNATGVATSDPASLTVRLPTGPAEDDFADRAIIDLTNTVFSASNTNATREEGEPDHGGKLGGHSVWFTWSTNANGIATFQTRGSGFDTILAVYTGKSFETLQVVAADDDRGDYLTSEVRFNVVAGTAYQIAVDGVGGRTGNFVLAWEFEGTAERLPVITTAPNPRAVRPGTMTSFTVGTGDTGLNYRWFFNGVPIVGATGPTLTLDPVVPADLGYYDVTLTNTFLRGVRSTFAALEFGPVPTAVSHFKVEDLLVASGLASLTETSAGAAMAGEWISSGPSPAASGVTGAVLPNSFVSVSVGTLDQQTFSTLNATSAGLCNGCQVLAGGAKYFGLEMTGSGVLILDTAGSTFDTVMSVYEFVSASGLLNNPCGALIGCDNNGGADGVTSRMSFPVVQGQRFVVQVAGINGARGTVALNWQLCPTPSPFLHIDGQLHLVTATNLILYPQDPFYYWYRDGQEVDATATPLLPLATPLPLASGYQVVMNVVTNGGIVTLTNHIGTVASAQAQVDASGTVPVFHLVLNGLQDLGFQVETTTVPLTNCNAPWHWEVVTNYTVSTQMSALVLSFPVEAPSKIYRVRPPPIATHPP